MIRDDAELSAETETPETVLTAEALAVRVLERAGNRPGRFILGIAGPPGAGKSTLATGLRDAVNGSVGELIAEVAPMDGFHLTNAQLRVAGALARKGEPDTFDVAGYLDRLRTLRESSVVQPVSWPVYDRRQHEPMPDGIGFEGRSIVITEGNYLLLDDFGMAGWSVVRDYLDEAWYVDASTEQLRKRLLHRHIRGGKSEHFAKIKVAQSDLMNAELVSRTRSRADLVLCARGRDYRIC